MEISEAPSSIAGDHPPSTKKIEHCKTMSPRRFPPPWYVEGDAVAGPASTRQALAADAPRAFRRRCSSATGARVAGLCLTEEKPACQCRA